MNSKISLEKQVSCDVPKYSNLLELIYRDSNFNKIRDDNYKSMVKINGVTFGYCRDNKKFVEYYKDKRRTGVISKNTSIIHMSDHILIFLI